MPPRNQDPLDSRYERLPDVIRSHVSRREFAWLDNEARNRLQEDFTEPEAGFVDE